MAPLILHIRLLFNRIYLSSSPTEIENFESIAQTPTLRACVTEIVWNDPHPGNLPAGPNNLFTPPELPEASEAERIVEQLFRWISSPRVHVDEVGIDGSLRARITRNDLALYFSTSTSYGANFHSEKADERALMSAVKSNAFPNLQQVIRGVCEHSFVVRRYISGTSWNTFDPGSPRFADSTQCNAVKKRLGACLQAFCQRHGLLDS